MSTQYYVLAVLITLSGLLTLLNKLRVLQQKDYMRQRIFADRTVYFPKLREYLYLLILLASLLGTTFAAIALTILFLALQGISIISRKFAKPRFTFRIILNGFICVVLTIIATILWRDYVQGVTFSAFVYLIYVIISNEIVRQIAFIGHRLELRKASAYLKSVNGLRTIGITGSYGKTTTKLFLNKILAEEAKLISTPGSVNTDIGLAKSINAQFETYTEEDKSALQFAVIETDAYVRGTIARVVSYFPLDLGVITSINEQHLETFGSDINNTVLANYELLEGLKPDGKKLAVFNFDNDYCKEIAAELQKDQPEVEIYTYGSGAGKDLDTMVSDVKSEIIPGGNIVSFELKFSERLGGTKLNLKLPVLGEFNAINYACAALVARLMGISDKAIVSASSKVELQAKTLGLRLTKSKVEIIDDSFNANPASANADLELIKERNNKFSVPNLILFSGLYDLGKESRRLHKEFAEALSADSTITQVITTNNALGRQLIADLPENEHRFAVVSNSDELINQIDLFLENLPKVGELWGRITIIGRIPAAAHKYIQSLE